MKKKDKKRIKKALLEIVENIGELAANRIEAARVLIHMEDNETAGETAVSINDLAHTVSRCQNLPIHDNDAKPRLCKRERSPRETLRQQ